MSSLLFLRWLPSCSFKSLDKAGHDSCGHSPRTLAPRACVQQATPSLPLNLGPTAACSAGPASWMQKLSSKVPLRHSHQHVLITSRVWKHEHTHVPADLVEQKPALPLASRWALGELERSWWSTVAQIIFLLPSGFSGFSALMFYISW